MKRRPEIHDPPKDGPITEIFVFVAHDETGDGIMAASLAGNHMPLITSKREVAMNLRTPARNVAKMQGKSVKLVRFSNREDMEDIN